MLNGLPGHLNKKVFNWLKIIEMLFKDSYDWEKAFSNRIVENVIQWIICELSSPHSNDRGSIAKTIPETASAVKRLAN